MIMPVSNINNSDYFIGPTLKDVNPVNRIPVMQTLSPEIQNKYAPNPNMALYSTQAMLPVDIPKPPVNSSNNQSNPPITSNNNKKFLFIAIAAIVAIILLTKK